MNRRAGLAVVGIIIISAALAFPLREIVNQLILVPLAYLLWLLGLVYRSVDQAIWWLVTTIVVLFALGASLLPEVKPQGRAIIPKREERGGVESLARAIQKSNDGVYSKWLVANRLGKLAHRALSLREHGKPRSPFAPLAAEGWSPPDEIQQYLEKGLHGSFADFSNTRRGYFAAPQKNALDHEVSEVIEFLESEVENKFGG